MDLAHLAFLQVREMKEGLNRCGVHERDGWQPPRSSSMTE